MNKAEVAPLQEIEADFRVGVNVSLVIEWDASFDQISSIEHGVRRSKDVEPVEKMAPAHLRTIDYGTGIYKSGPGNLGSLKSICTHDADRGVCLGERHHFFQALRKDQVVAENNLAVLAFRRNLTQSRVVVCDCTKELIISVNANSTVSLRIA
jgi:hypothetical protein